MATLDFNKTLSKPTFTLAWLSNTLNFSKTLSQPTFSIYADQWVLNTTLSRMTIASEVISGTISTITIEPNQPTLTTTSLVSQIYTSNLVINKPAFTTLLTSEIEYSFDNTMVRPTLVMSMYQDGYYNLTNILRRPTLLAQWLNQSVSLTTSKTYVLNTFNTAHTEYTNFSFNSYFVLNGKVYGVNSSGVYELSGDLDVASTIAAEVHLPVSSFEKQGLKACSDAFVLGRLAGDIELCVVLDEQEERTSLVTYSDTREGLHRIRTKIPKGLKGSVWQPKIKNIDGSNFAINNLELQLRELQRVR